MTPAHDPSQPPARRGGLSWKLGLVLLAVWIAATVVGALIGLLALIAKLALAVCALVWAVHVIGVLRRARRRR